MCDCHEVKGGVTFAKIMSLGIIREYFEEKIMEQSESNQRRQSLF